MHFPECLTVGKLVHDCTKVKDSISWYEYKTDVSIQKAEISIGTRASLTNSWLTCCLLDSGQWLCLETLVSSSTTLLLYQDVSKKTGERMEVEAEISSPLAWLCLFYCWNEILTSNSDGHVMWAFRTFHNILNSGNVTASTAPLRPQKRIGNLDKYFYIFSAASDRERWRHT